MRLNESTLAIARACRCIGRIDALPRAFRDAWLTRLFDPAEQRDFEFECEFYGRRYRGNIRSHIDWCVFFTGAYDKPTLGLLRYAAGLCDRPVLLDVGANVGHHSLFLSGCCHAVHAVEPWPEAVAALEHKISDNAIGNVTVHPVAFGERDGASDYFPPAGGNLGTGSLLAPPVAARQATPLRVTVARGDAYVERHIGRIELLKIDTEGYEMAVLRGLRATMTRWRPQTVLEVGPETAKAFGGPDGLRADLPPRYALFGISSVHRGFAFRLVPMRERNWTEFDNVFAMPAERAAAYTRFVRAGTFYRGPRDIPRILWRRALGADRA